MTQDLVMLTDSDLNPRLRAKSTGNRLLLPLVRRLFAPERTVSSFVIRPMWRRLPDLGPGQHENRTKIALAMLIQGLGVA
jgi:hypothetical protein